MTEKEPNRVWIISRKKKNVGGLIIYAVKSTERKAIDALEALRRDLIDRDGVHPGNIYFSVGRTGQCYAGGAAARYTQGYVHSALC